MYSKVKNLTETIVVKLTTNEVQELFGEIWINGAFWDWREFDTLEDANAWFDDPLKEDRQTSERKAQRELALSRQLDGSYLDPVTGPYKRCN